MLNERYNILSMKWTLTWYNSSQILRYVWNVENARAVSWHTHSMVSLIRQELIVFLWMVIMKKRYVRLWPSRAPGLIALPSWLVMKEQESHLPTKMVSPPSLAIPTPLGSWLRKLSPIALKFLLKWVSSHLICEKSLAPLPT